MQRTFWILCVFIFSNLLSKGQSEFIFPSSIEIIGNEKTKERIILRELMFEKGIKYSSEEFTKLIQSSKENLMNTSLFHNAEIITDFTSTDTAKITIKVLERWYLWPIPQVDIDERNFNVWWQKKSFDRLSAGIFLTQHNFRGRMENLIFQIMAGYNQQYGINYQIPYINKSKTIGIGTEFIWAGRHEVNNMTRNDQQIFFKNQDEFVRQELRAGISLQYRKSFYITHLLQANIQSYHFTNDLLDSSLNYSWNNQASLRFLALYYKFKIDHRNFKIYPLKGYYIDFEVFKYGLGAISTNHLDLWDLKTTLRKYWDLGNRFYLATGFMGKASNYAGNPFLLQKSLGFGRDFVRGYEYYVVDGQYYGVVKANLKYAIFPQRTSTVDFIKTTKFNAIPWAIYLNIFTDAGYVTRDNNESITNQLPGTFLQSTGVGLDFTTYYDKVVRFEISINKLGDTGFFLHFIAPI